MDSPASPVPDPSPLANRERALGIMATASVLALLYFARGVLVPITLAIILSLLIAPLVRLLRRLGLGQTLSVLAAVLVLALSFAAVAGVIGSQLIRMVQSLPRYERTIERKLKTLDDITVGRFNALTGQAGRFLNPRIPDERPAALERSRTRQGAAIPQEPHTLHKPGTLQGAGTSQPSGASQDSDTPQESGTTQASGTSQDSGSSQESGAAQDSSTSQASAASQEAEAEQHSGAVQQPVALRQPKILDQSRLLLLSEAGTNPIPVELHQPPLNPLQIIERILGSIWVPIETAGIVLVVLVFVLLEHEALRDRFIRIAGGADIRRTTLAINDAGARLSRFFVSQFAVNVGLGFTIWVGLTVIGLPHPLLWAALAGVLRFVPYIGVWIAALCSVLLAAAVDPHWALALETLGLFVVVELIAGQLVEPQLYGHTTGLSPLSVVIAAIFWSWLWGPIGLIVSTPLTLCLLVAGRHIKALNLLDILLGDTQALTMPERLYQRALSADSAEIIASARGFLKQDSFANYCDLVLMPALHLARIDLAAGTISADQQAKVRNALVEVIAAIGGDSRKLPRRHLQSSVLASTNVGRQLRWQREQISGQWQGPLVVPAGSVVVCVGLGSMSDDFATELLVRILRDQKIDARHMSLEDLNTASPPGAAEAVSIVYVVSAFPSDERGRGEGAVEEMRQRFPLACVVAVLLPGMLLQPEAAVEDIRGVDKAASSLGHAVQICLDLHRAV
jgi:predicted PurR-regulated permease PerM